MARSGDRVEQAGVYESGCDHGTRVALMGGAALPECRRHGPVSWTLLEATSETERAPTRRLRRRSPQGDPAWQVTSGERCRHTGLYQSLCTDEIRVALMRGSRLPTCGNHGDVTWALITGRRFGF